MAARVMSGQMVPWTRDRIATRIVLEPTGCWRWTGARTTSGYGLVSMRRDGRRIGTTAHRVSYEVFVGPIPAGLDIDHLCLNRSCVNPAHLEAVTHRENVRRMPGMFGRRARADRCDRGHELVARSDGRRRCPTCHRSARRAKAKETTT